MKKLRFTLGALLVAGSVAFTLTFTPGCSIFGGGGTTVSTNAVNTVSNYLAMAVTEAVAYGLKADSNATLAYAPLAKAAIGEVLGGADFSPGALDAAIQKLPAAVLQTQTAGIITTTIESIYQIYWASDVQNTVNGQYAAKAYLGALVAGIDNGLAGKGIPVPLAKIKRPSVRSK